MIGKGYSNYESIKVFPEWKNLVDFVEYDINRFEKIWDNKDPNLKTYKTPEAIKEEIFKLRSENRPYDYNYRNLANEKNNKWKHQEKAVEIFLDKKRGILEMATGTGKTITSLKICEELLKYKLINSIIITTDGNDLMEQWYKNVVDYDISNKAQKKLTILRHFGSLYKEKDYYNLYSTFKLIIVSRPELRSILKSLDVQQGARTLLIHDEVHKLGSPGNIKNLSGLTDQISYRLGLSATPERKYDDVGNVFILEHIGEVIFQFGIENAIKKGILSPFEYFPLIYEPSSEDTEKIRRIRARFEASKKTSNPMTKMDMFISISKVYKNSESKIPVFKEFINDSILQILKRCIIFVDETSFGNKILEFVHMHTSDFHTYFQGDSSKVLKRFANGELDCLITCHRLSEGIRY